MMEGRSLVFLDLRLFVTQSARGDAVPRYLLRYLGT